MEVNFQVTSTIIQQRYDFFEQQKTCSKSNKLYSKMAGFWQLII